MSISQAQRMREFLDLMCACVAQKRPLPRWSWRAAAVPIAAGLAATAGMAGCSDDEESSPEGQAGQGGQVQGAEVCNDHQDNDGDGHIDCGDTDCMGAAACPGPEYGAPADVWQDHKVEDVLTEPAQELCGDNLDNDGDGLKDCDDSDCDSNIICMGAEYAGPFESICDDQKDNDGDSKVDCDDPDCAASMPCGADYAAPFDGGQD